MQTLKGWNLPSSIKIDGMVLKINKAFHIDQIYHTFGFLLNLHYLIWIRYLL